MKEWKIDTWWKKTLITAAAINGLLTIISFTIGLIEGYISTI